MGLSNVYWPTSRAIAGGLTSCTTRRERPGPSLTRQQRLHPPRPGMLARTFMEYLCLGMSSTRHLLISFCARCLQPKLLRPSVKPNPIPCLVAAQRRQYTASGKVFKSRGVGVGSRTTSTVDSTVRAMATSSQALELEVVEVDNPKELNFILGHSHFIKTVEDIYEVLVQSGMALKFGIAFCEASGDRKVRFDGNDEELTNLAKQNAMKLGAGHSFIVFLDKGFPVSVLNAIKAVPEVCRIHCATANPTSVIVGKLGEERKGILGVIDGFCPLDYENEHDKKQRHEFLRMVGYKR